jgi:hypothetical protein
VKHGSSASRALINVALGLNVRNADCQWLLDDMYVLLSGA